MTAVTAYDKAVARAAARAIGGEPRVIEYGGIAVLQHVVLTPPFAEAEMEYWNLDRPALL